MSETESVPQDNLLYAKYDNPKLHKPISPVKPFEFGSSELKAIEAELLAATTITDSDGTTRKVVGVTTNQLRKDIDKAMFSMKLKQGDEVARFVTIANPEITYTSGDTNEDGFEGCLNCESSDHFMVSIIPRANEIVLEGFDLDGNPLRFELRDKEARAAQHETDHTKGIDIIDRAVKLFRVGKEKEQIELLRKDINQFPQITSEEARAELQSK